MEPVKRTIQQYMDERAFIECAFSFIVTSLLENSFFCLEFHPFYHNAWKIANAISTHILN